MWWGPDMFNWFNFRWLTFPFVEIEWYFAPTTLWSHSQHVMEYLLAWNMCHLRLTKMGRSKSWSMELYFESFMLSANSFNTDGAMHQIAPQTIIENLLCLKVGCRRFLKKTTFLLIVVWKSLLIGLYWEGKDLSSPFLKTGHTLDTFHGLGKDFTLKKWLNRERQRENNWLLFLQ